MVTIEFEPALVGARDLIDLVEVYKKIFEKSTESRICGPARRERRPVKETGSFRGNDQVCKIVVGGDHQLQMAKFLPDLSNLWHTCFGHHGDLPLDHRNADASRAADAHLLSSIIARQFSAVLAVHPRAGRIYF